MQPQWPALGSSPQPQPDRPSQELLLPQQYPLKNLSASSTKGTYNSSMEDGVDKLPGDAAERTQTSDTNFTLQTEDNLTSAPVYKTYKRRWFGLVQLVLLNIVVSWNWLTYSPIANTAAEFFSTTPTIINWLSTSFLFAFVAASPFCYYALQKYGPKVSIMISALLLLLGNWIRYAGTRASPPSYTAVMVGQILIGFAQPFVLASPTAYSDLWFTARGRVSATAFASLANPFGGALGQLIDPFLATSPADVAPMTLYVSIIATVATIPSFFIPAKPPTPAAASSNHVQPPVKTQIATLFKNPTFLFLFIPYVIYVGLFNSFSSILTQILTPYGFSEEESGIAGAVLILVGLVTAAVTSPLTDRYKKYLLLIKVLVPLLGISYLVFIWAPPSRSIAAPYVICAVIGATSFSLVPVVLEFVVEVTYPVGPALSSVVLWTGGQILGGIFIIISGALNAGENGDPQWNLQRALIFQAVVALVAVPFVMGLGLIGDVKRKRQVVDLGV